jgi:hypothetical protein
MDMPRLDKSQITIGGPLDNREEEMAYWHRQSPEERLRAMELMRRINYGEHASTARLQRLFEVVERE